MSNPLFENPKVALGFAGVAVAAALVASVALNEFTPDSEGETQVVAASEAGSDGETSASYADASRARPGSGSGSRSSSGTASTGWADDGGGLSDDWGSASVATPLGDPSQDGDPNMGDPGSPTFGDFAPSEGSTPGRSSSSQRPGVRSGAAPNAPSIRPPGGGPLQGEITSNN